MAESDEQFCGVCEAQYITKQAEHWCPECEEGLCADCFKYHKASKYARSHEVISIEVYKSLTPNVAHVVQNCQDHGKKYQLYCSQHECLCCTDCLSEHHVSCSGILGVEKLAKNAKSSTLLIDIERTLRDIEVNLDRILKEKEKHLAQITTQRQQIHDEIKDIRSKINCKLDIMENQLMRDLDDEEKVVTFKNENLLLELNDKAKLVQELQDTIKVFKQHATDLQTFLMSKSLKKSSEAEEKYVKSLFAESKLHQYDLELIINDQVSEFFSSVKSLGTITCSERPTTITYHTEKEKEAQMFSQSQEHSTKSIDDIDIKLIREFQMTGYQSKHLNITGCTINFEGKIIFADNINHCLVVLNDDGKVEGQISTKPSRPWDVTCIDDNRVAVTCNDPYRILLINIASKAIEKTIARNNLCYGIQHREGTLFYHESMVGLQTYNLTTSAIAVIVKTDINSTHKRYVAVSGKRIYIAQYENHLVLCYSDTGEKIWEYFNNDILKYPLAVEVDKNSNVYVASYLDACVFVISSDGKKIRKLINPGNKLFTIRIVIDKRDRLLVVDCKGNMTVYTI